MNFSWMMQRLRQGAVFAAIFALAVGLLCSPKIIHHFKKSRASQQPVLSGTTFPYVIQDASGRRTTIGEKPERIISLSPSITEILFALHAEDRLVGTSRYCVYPPPAKLISKVGGINDPNLESLKALKPDVIFCTILTPKRITQAMEAAGLKVVAFDHQRLKEVERDTKIIGSLIGSDEVTKNYLADFHARLASVNEKAKTLQVHPTAIILYGLDSLHVAGIESFSGEILKVAGGVNLGERTGLRWTQLSMENLVKWNPEIIFVDSYSDEAESESLRRQVEALRRDSRWKSISAVQNNRIYIFYDSLLSIPGPRMIDLAEKMQEAVLGAVNLTPR